MTSVALCSASGAPGVSTTSVLVAPALGAALGVGATVVEAALSGGTLAGPLGLEWSPSVVTLAAALRHDVASLVAAHAQRGPGGVGVVVGASGEAEAAAAAARLVGPLAAVARSSAGVMVLDCGRLSVTSVLWPLATAADLAVVVLRQSAGTPRETAAPVGHARALAVALGAGGARVGAVVVGDEPYSGAEVGAALGLRALGVLPLDPAGVAGALSGARRRRRGRLGVAVERLVAEMVALVGPESSPAVAQAPRADEVVGAAPADGDHASVLRR